MSHRMLPRAYIREAGRYGKETGKAVKSWEWLIAIVAALILIPK